MEDENIVYENIDPEDDNERYVLTPWGCLHCAFDDFGLRLPEISGKMAEALMNDFFEIMEHALLRWFFPECSRCGGVMLYDGNHSWHDKWHFVCDTCGREKWGTL